MGKCCFVILMCSVVVLMSQTSLAETVRNKTLYDKADASLQKGDTLEALAMYKSLRAEIDSVSRIDYANQVQALHTSYQIDELYLENKEQEVAILWKASLFLSIILVLFVFAFYHLRNRNRKLIKSRQKAIQLKEEAEQSTEEKSKLLYAVTSEMTEYLSEMRSAGESLQTASPEDVRTHLSKLRYSVEKLQRIYNQIFS